MTFDDNLTDSDLRCTKSPSVGILRKILCITQLVVKKLWMMIEMIMGSVIDQPFL